MPFKKDKQGAESGTGVDYKLPLRETKHEIFAQAILRGLNQRDAAIEAGYSEKSARTTGSNLSRHPDVYKRIQELTKRSADVGVAQAAISRTWVLEMLKQNALRAMELQEVRTRDGEVTHCEYDGAVANRALELLGKEQGMFVDRSLELSKLRPEEMPKEFWEQAQKAVMPPEETPAPVEGPVQ